MKVYHGSYIEIEDIDLEKSEAGKDFGRGFYVTKSYSQAETWAKRKGAKKRTNGFVTEYDFKPEICNMMKLRVLCFEKYNEDWFDFILENRMNEDRDKQMHDYDVVEGPVANDEVATRIYDFQRGYITKQQFLSELKFKKPTHQICFCTVQSLQALSKVHLNSDVASMHLDYDVIQALMTDFQMSEKKATDLYYKSKLFQQIADERTEFYKKNWHELYTLLCKELKYK